MEETTPAPLPKRARSSGVVIPEKARWHGRLAAFLIVTLVRLIASTLRYRRVLKTSFFPDAKSGPVIFCMWHNRVTLIFSLYEREIRRQQKNRRIAGLVSASRDGGLLARILELFGVQPVRGSSSRRGTQALRELVSWAEKGLDLAVTPDGPRGPRYCIQDGVIAVAQLTGLPIVPVSYHLSRKITLKSWDRFQIPLPFCRCTYQVGEPLSIPREANDDQRAGLKAELEKRMRAITED